MSTTAIGRRAEAAAASYLTGLGYTIVEHNYRTRWCEIDIIAQKDGVVSFVEVKYRGDGAQGEGLDYVTPKKLQQMTFAAELWLAGHPEPRGSQLAAIEVSGDSFTVSNFILI